MTELKITQADIDRAHEWMRGQTTGLRMMLTKPRGIYEMLAAHRIAAEEGKAELVEALEDVLDSVGALSNLSEFPNCLGITEDRGREILAALARVRGEG